MTQKVEYCRRKWNELFDISRMLERHRLSFTVKELALACGDDARIIGDPSRKVSRPSVLANNDADDLVFCRSNDRSAAERINRSAAGLAIVQATIDLDSLDTSAKTILLTSNPRLAFSRIVARFFVPASPHAIHPKASIHPEAIIGENVHVGAFTYVGRSRIGSNSVLHGGCQIYDNVAIGSNVVVHSGTVLGVDAFAYERTPEGRLEKFPQIGGITIEDNVEIGANCCVDRGALENTVIGSGTKLGMNVHVGHNAIIGNDTLIAAHVAISGSVKVGDRVWIGTGVVLRDHLVVGNDAFIAFGSLVGKSVADGARVYPVNEARHLTSAMKALFVDAYSG